MALDIKRQLLWHIGQIEEHIDKAEYLLDLHIRDAYHYDRESYAMFRMVQQLKMALIVDG